MATLPTILARRPAPPRVALRRHPARLPAGARPLGRPEPEGRTIEFAGKAALGRRCDVAARVGNQARFIAATDAELVLASTAGDRDAVAVVWDRYAKASRQCLRTKLGFQDVEDLLQDVFVAFLTSVHRIRNQDSLRAYLLAIAAKLANHDMRRRRTRRVVSLSDTGEMPDVASPPPDFEGRESLLALQHALDRMPLRVRLGYCLFHFSGLDLKEVARTLGVSSATAKRALARARRRLVRLEGRTPSWSKIEKERS